jgi:hypothetical protein
MRLIPPSYVKTFVKTKRTMRRILRLLSKPRCARPFGLSRVKTGDQQSCVMLFCTRQMLVSQRTQMPARIPQPCSDKSLQLSDFLHQIVAPPALLRPLSRPQSMSPGRMRLPRRITAPRAAKSADIPTGNNRSAPRFPLSAPIG